MQLSERAMNAAYRVSERIAAPGEPHEVVEEILKVLDEALGYRNGMVTLVDPDSGDLIVEAVRGIPEERYRDIRYHRGEGITGLILETGTPLALPRIGGDPRFAHKLKAYPSDDAFLGVPVPVAGKVGGGLTAAVDRSERYQLEEHLRVASTFANLIGAVTSRTLTAEKERQALVREKDRLEGELKSAYRPDRMVGTGKSMREVFDTIAQVAKWNTTVLVRGESGTGKELVAKAIHYQSARAGGPFVKMNCAALPDTLLESELFGYEKGAFTGAVGTRQGRFELADGGTLFLDEIGDTSASFQAKLLRVLQERQFERLGGTKTLSVDVRLIAATNVDLERAVAERRFREDLYYRLNVMPIFLPPLRERREDIPSLIDFFLDKLAREQGGELAMADPAREMLQRCDFPGNIRELENCVQRAAVTSRDGTIRAEDVPCGRAGCGARIRGVEAAAFPGETGRRGEEDEVERILSIADERERVMAALRKTGWVQAKAARLLRMTPRQIGYRVKTLGIDLKEY